MIISADKNGNIVQGDRNYNELVTPGLADMNNVVLGALNEKQIKDNKKYKKLKLKREKVLLKKQKQERLEALKLNKEKQARILNAEMRNKKILQVNNILKSEMYLDALKKPYLENAPDHLSGHPLAPYGSGNASLVKTNLMDEGKGHLEKTEHFGNGTLFARNSYENGMEGFLDDINPFRIAGQAVAVMVDIGGSLYEAGSEAARMALRAADEKITGGKIADIADDTDLTIKSINASADQRIDDISNNAALAAQGILNAAMQESQGLVRGKIGEGLPALKTTAGDTLARTYEDTSDAWFETKKGLEQTGAGRSLLTGAAKTMKATDPGQGFLAQDKLLKKIPGLKHIYKEVNIYSGGLVSRALSASAMPGKLIRGNAGLQLTDERVSRAEFIQNMVFYMQVAITVTTAGAAGGLIIIIASSMKQGPIGQTNEGRTLLTLIEISALASSGGTGSIMSNIQSATATELRRKAAEKASQKVAEKTGTGILGQVAVQAAFTSGSMREAVQVGGKNITSQVIVTEASKKTGTTGGLLTSVALETTWATVGAPSMRPDGKVATTSEIAKQVAKQQILEKSRTQAVSMGKSQLEQRLGEENTDLLIFTGEMAYSGYETDQKFTNKLASSLKDKAYNETLKLADKKQTELVNKQNALINQAISMPEQKANEAIQKTAELEAQIYDIQRVRDNVLDQAKLAPQQAQDQLAENAKALGVKLSKLPDTIKTKAQRETEAAQYKVRQAEEMVKRNLAKIEQFKATDQLGEKIHDMGVEAKELRDKAANLSLNDAKKALLEAVKIEELIIELYKILYLSEQKSIDMEFNSALNDVLAGTEYAAINEGRYRGRTYQYDYRHPFLIYRMVPGRVRR